MANLTAVTESVNAQGPDLLARRRLGAGSRTTTQHPEPMRVQSFAVAAVLTSWSAAPAAGQTIPSAYRFIETRQEAGMFAGWVAPETGQFGFGPGPGPIIGARYGIGLRGPVSLEGVLGWISTTRDVVDPRRQPGERVRGDADATLLQIDARLKFSITGQRTWHALNPFLLAGIGVARDLAGGSPLEETEGLDQSDRFRFRTALVGSFGGGISWFLSEQWIARIDGLLHIWRLKVPDGFRDPERGFEAVGESEWVSARGLSFGVGYRF